MYQPRQLVYQLQRHLIQVYTDLLWAFDTMRIISSAITALVS